MLHTVMRIKDLTTHVIQNETKCECLHMAEHTIHTITYSHDKFGMGIHESNQIDWK